MILATVVASPDAKPDQSFFPLSVDYQERFAAAGKIPGNFFRRETRLSDYEILFSRLVDRAVTSFVSRYFSKRNSNYHQSDFW
jgi:polyribonucleotide nucleotidyltransferase